MLQIQNVRKQYITGELVQTALDGVSLTLRDNEFVAILGPSGSGKTTLLNVIGGLDRYDSGDLIINGISTKKYSDRDWDSYRNHSVGFVFQSYNLIPHQTVLSNVELALTISGISRSERKRRAIKALEDVGLGDQLHKRPNQMSGGQMQRVAIARALVNDPDILLADEPTGALDSETSVQVMDLLKKVSQNKLVVMVTHNPELAEAYANRIVRVKDGRIVDDSNPCVMDIQDAEPPKHKNMGRASMSFLTALSLSFNNLWTKKGRTILTAFAGSIGIIGIALILSLSTGFQMYIDQIQEETLSNYPLMIQTETTDMTAMLSTYGSILSAGENADPETVVEQQMLWQMFTQVRKNDLESFCAYLNENYALVADEINDIKYYYGVKPCIYSADVSNGVKQVNPSTLFGELTGMSQMSAFMDTDVFYELINNREMLESQYDVLRGRWPETSNELVVVLSSPNQISDYMAYTLGLKDSEELLKLMEQTARGEDIQNTEEPGCWTYDDLMALEFRLVAVSDKYRYNSEYNVWEDMSDDSVYMENLVVSGIPLRVVGIVCPKEDVSSTLLSAGVAYHPELTNHVMQHAADSIIVTKQLENPDINVFTGKLFGEEDDDSGLNFEDMITIDDEKISGAFGMNISTSTILSLIDDFMEDTYASLDVDTSVAKGDFITMFSELAKDMLSSYISDNANDQGEAELKLSDAQSIVSSYLNSQSADAIIGNTASKYGMSSDTLRSVSNPLLTTMLTSYITMESLLPGLPEIPDVPDAPESDGETDPTVQIPDEEINDSDPAQEDSQEPPMPFEDNSDVEILSSKNGYYISLLTEETETEESTPPVSEEETDDDIEDVVISIHAMISAADVERVVSDYMATGVVDTAADAVSVIMMEDEIKKELTRELSKFMSVLMSYVGGSIRVDEEMLASAFQFNLNEDELRRLMAAMTGTKQEKSAEANLKALGYAEEGKPTAISIYFVDFESKSQFLEFLDDYNDQMEAAGREEQIISYTDVTNIMMSSVRTIIDSVSYVLIAFVAVSLVVSSIMIGIITYISVMERTKEIGVLRAIGASKRNISQVFNAETFIIGLCSGVLGVVCTLLLIIPINYIIHRLTNNLAINAQLPVTAAMILIALSMLLTITGGLIPSRHAAKKDPVIALRSE